MTLRIVGKKNRPDGDPVELFRFDTLAPPINVAQRFTLGAWRESTLSGAPTIATLISLVQRGQLVDLPVVDGADFDALDSGASVIEHCTISYGPVMANSIGIAPNRVQSEAWEPAVKTHPMFVIAQTRFTIGTHSWWLVERGSIAPISGRPAFYGTVGSSIQASIFSVDPAARKAFSQFVAERDRGEDQLVAFPAMASQKLRAFAPTDTQIAAGLALFWADKHAAEEKAKEVERQRAEKAALALLAQKVKEKLEEDERQRRIAAGDVTILNDLDLAARLRARRAKGMS